MKPLNFHITTWKFLKFIDGCGKERRCNTDPITGTPLPFALFLTSAAKYDRSAVCWVITQRVNTLPVRFSSPLECFITAAAIWWQYQPITHKPRAFYKVQCGAQLRGPSSKENGKLPSAAPSPELQTLSAVGLTLSDWDGMQMSGTEQYSCLIQQVHHRLTRRVCQTSHEFSILSAVLGNLVSPD